MDYKSLYEEQLKKNEQLTEELDLHKMNTDELQLIRDVLRMYKSQLEREGKLDNVEEIEEVNVLRKRLLTLL